MKKLFTLIMLLGFTIGLANAQNGTETSQSKVVVSHKALKKVSVDSNEEKNKIAASKMERAERIDTKAESKTVVMTNDYIDAEVAKLQKVIHENANTEGFNASGYLKRIEYLESRRPKK